MPFDKDHESLQEFRDDDSVDFRWWFVAMLVSIGMWLLILEAVDVVMGAL